jgi:hypothetical protein
MISGKKIAIGGTAFLLLAVGVEILWLHHERTQAEKPAATVDTDAVDPDDNVFLKRERPSTPADLKDLVGKTIWVSAGGQMEYYPSNGHHADYTHSAGTLLGAEPLVVKDVFEQVAPKGTAATFRIPAGEKHVLLAFTLPKSADPNQEYAVPVGYKDDRGYAFSTDEIFFYDDPHVLYQHWGPQVWQAVDSHQVILGMSEREVQLSLGQVSKSESTEMGNRLVVYANMGHPMAVTYKVTAFRPDQGF